MSLTQQSATDPNAPRLPAASKDEIARIQENLIAHFRLFADLPGVTFVDAADATWVASQGVPGSLILRTQFQREPIDQQIEEFIRQLGQHTNSFDWFVFPSCQPRDLGARLATYGQAGGPDHAWTLAGNIGGPGGTWMLRDLTSLPNIPQVTEDFHIEYVCNQAMLAEWVEVSLVGFGNARPTREQIPTNTLYAAYARHGFGLDATSLHYIGYLGDQPVTSSTLLLAGGIAGLFDISTLPAFRRLGLGSAISAAMLQEAQRRGFAQAYVWSSTMGRPVYQGVGFVPIELGMCEYSWQKRYPSML